MIQAAELFTELLMIILLSLKKCVAVESPQLGLGDVKSSTNPTLDAEPQALATVLAAGLNGLKLGALLSSITAMFRNCHSLFESASGSPIRPTEPPARGGCPSNSTTFVSLMNRVAKCEILLKAIFMRLTALTPMRIASAFARGRIRLQPRSIFR